MGPKQTNLCFIIETRKERLELGTKTGQPNRNQLMAPGKQGQDHPVCNYDLVEDLGPQHPAWPLMSETL